MFNNHKMGSSDSLLNAIKDIMEKKHTTPETPKEKALAKLAHPKDKITHKDVLVGRGVLKKENSGDRMGVIVGTRKEKVEIEPKLKEGKQVTELKQSTVKSYTDKANKQMKKIGKKMMNSPDDYDGLDDKEQNTLRKRQAGFDMTFRKGVRASQKTTKEEVENVDEAGMSASTIKHKTNISKMSPAEFANHPHYKELSDKVLQSMAWRHGYGGPGTSGHDYYVNKRKKGMNEEVEQVGEAAKWRKGPEGKSWKSNPMSDPEDDEGEKAVYGSSKLPNVPAHKATGKITKDTYAKLGSRKAVKKLKYRPGVGVGPKGKLPEEVENVDERKLTGAETEKKEKYVLSMKKKMGGFKQRYGERAKEVMYATATKMAKEETQKVDELSKKTLGSYVSKVAGLSPEKVKPSRETGIEKASKKYKMKENTEVQEVSTGLVNRYLSKTQDDDKRQSGRALALTKKWGGKVGGTAAPKVPSKD
jgi:hypothetical protein